MWKINDVDLCMQRILWLGTLLHWDRGQVPLETVWWGQEAKEQTGGLFSQWLNQGQFCSCIKTDSWFSSSWMSLISSDYCPIPHWHSCESHKTKCRYCMCVFRQKTEGWSGLFKEFWPLNLFSLFFKLSFRAYFDRTVDERLGSVLGLNLVLPGGYAPAL